MEPQKEPNPNTLPYPLQPQNVSDEIDLRELFKVLWKGKWIIIVTTFVFAIGSVLYAISLPNIYKADALLAPAESSNGGGLSSMASQLGGLANLAGVNLGASESSQTDIAVQVLKSRKFIENFIIKHDLLITLMATKAWDISNDELIYDEEIYNVQSKEWLRKPTGLRKSKPSSLEAYDYFIEHVLEIKQDKDSGLYQISVMHYSPNIAKEWVDWLIEDINIDMRKRAIDESSRNLKYLNEQLNRTSYSEMQSTFYKLIEEQMKSLMLAEAQEEYVFKIIDPSVVPENKAKPKRAIICILGTMLGILFSILFLTVPFIFKK
ncbi:Wzz/FepE/Etk N-terminal domain-containing protein [Vibrio parahaemolyticus]|nr:LPS O-antigen length regulator [Vibrio parahaemolyticus]HCG7637962.1 LPS O-antigen length regulator [Vibrio parahaemolyticus]